MPFTIRVRVELRDLDELQHVSNLVYLRWVQDSAVAHSAAVGLGVEAYLERQAAFVVRRHEIDYLRSAVLGDEVDVQTQVASAGSASAERHTEIRRASDGLVLARATTVWAYIDLRTGRPTRIPDDVRDRFTIEPMEGPPARRR